MCGLTGRSTFTATILSQVRGYFEAGFPAPGSDGTSIDIAATFEHGQIDGETIILFDHRNAPRDRRQRFVALVRAADHSKGDLALIELKSSAFALTLHANAKTNKKSGQDIRGIDPFNRARRRRTAQIS